MGIKEHYQKFKSILGLGFVLAKANFKLRNEGSYLGIFWYLLNPLLVFGLLYLVFSDRLGGDIPQYPIYLLIGVIVFNFFQGATTESVKIIIGDYRGVIKSINFPRESLIIAIVIKNLFSHFFEIIFLIAVLIFFHVSLIGMLYYLPILFLLCLFIFGMSLFIAFLTVYFLDLESIWSFAMRLLWLATPIFYSISGQIRLYYLNLLNPMYYFITVARDVIAYNKVPDNLLIFGMIFYTLLSFSIGIFTFNILKNKFAERI